MRVQSKERTWVSCANFTHPSALLRLRGQIISNFPSDSMAPPLRMLCLGFGIYLRNISN